jgi:hypothetical protein
MTERKAEMKGLLPSVSDENIEELGIKDCRGGRDGRKLKRTE